MSIWRYNEKIHVSVCGNEDDFVASPGRELSLRYTGSKALAVIRKTPESFY